MLKDCENGRINIVLCKTQDRFARDMEIIEKYLHNKFMEWNVRFVSIVDHADTNDKGNKKNRQITGLTNEWYLEDLSNNIKSTFNSKRENGDFVGSFAPYGYLKERDIKKALHLIIDPVASKVVQRIFKEYSEGKSTRAIARELNNEGILSPSEYKWNNGYMINIPTKEYDSLEFMKTGSYIIKTSFFNEKNIGNDDIKNFITFKLSNESFKDNCTLKLIDSNAIDIYYTIEQVDETKITNILNNKKWKKLQKKEIIPLNTKYICSCFKNNKKYEELFIMLELKIEKNTKRESILFNQFTYHNDLKNDILFEVGSRYKSIWCQSTINRMLSNPVYIGTLTQGKTTTISYKNHTTVRKPKEEWNIYQNAHDPIIDESTWSKVQERKYKDVSRVKNNSSYVNIFSGILKCAYCGKNFNATKCGRKTDKFRADYFICGDRSTKFSNCENRCQLRKDELEKLTLEQINIFLEKLKKDDLLNQSYNDIISNKSGFSEKIDSIKAERKQLVKLKNKNQKFSKELYESMISGLITKEEYFNFKEEYKLQIDNANERLSALEREEQNIARKKQNLSEKNSILKKYNHIDELNYNVIHDLINEIKIGVKTDNKRKIEFLWNF